MAQSYGNLSNSTILAATDEILGVSWVEQQLGTSLSALDPDNTVTAGLTLSLNIDQDGAQVIALDANDDLNDIAADIQAKVRALTVIGFADQAALDDFTCRWDSALKKLVLTSGTAYVQPPAYSQIPAVVVTGGSAATPLKLGVAQDGTESYTGAEVRTYTVKYRFVYGAGRNFGSADVVVYSSQMAVPTDLAELEAIANARASQMKAQEELTAFTSGDDATLIGPVSL